MRLEHPPYGATRTVGWAKIAARALEAHVSWLLGSWVLRDAARSVNDVRAARDNLSAQAQNLGEERLDGIAAVYNLVRIPRAVRQLPRLGQAPQALAARLFRPREPQACAKPMRSRVIVETRGILARCSCL